MAGRTESEWVAEGRAVILHMVEALHAVLWPEVEARAGEAKWSDHLRVDVNHLMTAREQLLAEGAIEKTLDNTRGGRALAWAYHLPLARGNTTRIARTAARKRLLYARWYGWAVGDARYPAGFVGVGGERVVRASFSAARPNLYIPVEIGFGPVSNVFGQPILPGSLDSGAWMITRTGGVTGRPMLVPVEVKNLREWLFPHSHQPYQVLAKAAAIQLANPDQLMAPLLICRRRHIQTLYMAKDLGFLIVEAKRQFLLPSADYTEADVEEVRDGIGFYHLTSTDQADALLVSVFNDTLPVRGEALAERWRGGGAQFLGLYQTLADDRRPKNQRDHAFVQLRDAASKLPYFEGGW